MNPQPFAAIDAKIDQARRLVVEEQQRAWGLHTRDDEAAKSCVLIHDLTHWLHKLEAQRENLLRLSRLHSARSLRRLAARAPFVARKWKTSD
jgi:hypothetical protein